MWDNQLKFSIAAALATLHSKVVFHGNFGCLNSCHFINLELRLTSCIYFGFSVCLETCNSYFFPYLTQVGKERFSVYQAKQSFK